MRARVNKIISSLLLVSAIAASAAAAGMLPIEPEEENVEYLLDLWTNRFDRSWREAWDGGYNRFRFRLGSNNVRDWFIEEELKFASPLTRRLRFLFYHTRLIHDSSDRQAHDVLEIEGRLRKSWYVSLLIEPAFEKAENSLSLALQHRTAVNRYTRVYLEFPHLVRNFAERHGDTSGKTLTVFTGQPVRFGVDLREPLVKDLWLGVKCAVTPVFTTSFEDGSTGVTYSDESGHAVDVNGWMEYRWKRRRYATRENSGGIEFGYTERKKDREWEAPPINTQANGAVGRPDPAASWLDRDFYLPTEPDSIYNWKQTRAYVGPFVWVPLDDGSVFKCSVWYDARMITWRDGSRRTRKIKTNTVVGGVGIKKQIGRNGRSVEGGFAAEYRRRTEENSGGGLAEDSLEENINDRRIYLAYEHRFGRAKVVRLIETIDLDKEDWGAFSIHDHAFVQLLFEF